MKVNTKKFQFERKNIMNVDTKKLIKPIITAVVGLFGLIFLALDYFTAHAEAFGQSISQSLANGYQFAFFGNGARLEKLFELESTSASFFAYIASILLIVFLLASIALLLVGVAKILVAFNILNLPKVDWNKIENILDIAFGGAAVLALLFTLIFGLINGESEEIASISYLPSVGAWLIAVLGAAKYAVAKLYDKFVPAAAPATEAPASTEDPAAEAPVAEEAPATEESATEENSAQ